MPNILTYIISNIDKALAFEWIAEEIDKSKFDISFILLNPAESQLEFFLKEKQIPVIRVKYRGKKDLPSAFIQVRKALKKLNTQIVHTHLFEASLVGLLAAKSLGIKKRIYTRHHATLHHQYFPRAVYYDRFLNYLATDIIAISDAVRQVLVAQEGVSPKKLHKIPHGFPLAHFSNPITDNIQLLKEKYKTPGKFPVIGIIARQTIWKGVQYIIPAFAQLLKEYPKAYLILANAQGDYKNEINRLLGELPQESYTEIKFEADLYSLYQLFDIYVHTPIDHHSEAFGQTYVEALAAGIPSVFTLSGIASEFIEHERNALVVPFQDVESIYQAFTRLLDDKALSEKLRTQGRKDVQDLFTLQKMIASLETLYEF